MMEYKDLVHDFADRTRINLELLRKRKKDGDEVYEVTQLINSMLGLMVLPNEQYRHHIPMTTLDELRNQGWPEPVLTVTDGFKRPANLRELMKFLRNSVAHFNIDFTSNGDQIDGVTLSNKCYCGKTTWQATLSLENLEILTERYIELIAGCEVSRLPGAGTG